VTRPAVIERGLLFKPGDHVSVRVIEETERLLRDNHFLYDVDIRPVAYHDGVVDIEVLTRDTWTLDLTGRYARSGGTNTTSWGILDYNFLGTATQLGVSNQSDVDRRGSLFQVSNAPTTPTASATPPFSRGPSTPSTRAGARARAGTAGTASTRSTTRATS
jgi:outer membrane protein assembly factor BamA